jgi:hypothetical protein
MLDWYCALERRGKCRSKAIVLEGSSVTSAEELIYAVEYTNEDSKSIMMMMMSISPFGHKTVGDLLGRRDVFTSVAHVW